MDALWRIQLLGGLRASQGERSLTHFRTHKVGLLLAYLAYYPQRAHAREELIELLWPGCDLSTGRNNLRVALSSLRQQLEPPDTSRAPVPRGQSAVLVADQAGVRLKPGGFTTDVAAFEAALAAARDRSAAPSPSEQAARLTEAAGLYQGELLPGRYEAWILLERERLAEAYLQALRPLSAFLEQAGDLPQAIEWARRAVCVDPLSEASRERLIRLLAAAGEPAAALRQCRELEGLMEREWGVAPGLELRELAHSLEQHGAALSGRRAAPPRQPQAPGQPPADLGPGRRQPAVASTRPEPVRGKAAPEALPSEFWSAPVGKLPRQLTRFFGREAEIAELCALLSGTQHRGTETRTVPRSLVTLTGPGGAGKTRLALAAAARLPEVVPVSVWFVPLQDITDPRLILDRVLAALQLPRSSQTEPLQQAVAFLSQQPGYPRSGCMLLLDNFEHLINGGAAIVRALLDQAPALACLVTSRQRLGLAVEQEFPVAPLPIPGVQAFSGYPLNA